MLRQTMISICRRHVKKLKDSYLSERVARYLSLLPEVNLAFSIDIVIIIIIYLLEFNKNFSLSLRRH